MTIGSPSDIYSDPKAVAVLTTEEFELGYPVPLAGGDAIESASSTLYDLNTNEAIVLDDVPTWVGATISQWIRGTQLTALHGYRLEITWTGTPSGQKQTVVTLVNVPVASP